jgi:DNA-binding CsgD family transcriptional regulator
MELAVSASLDQGPGHQIKGPIMTVERRPEGYMACTFSPPMEATGRAAERAMPDAVKSNSDAFVAIDHANRKAMEIVLSVAKEKRLSQREFEVLAATTHGQSTKQIGFAMGISARTVAYYWEQIFRKLGCRSQIEVMSLLFRRASATEAPSAVAASAPTAVNGRVDAGTR